MKWPVPQYACFLGQEDRVEHGNGMTFRPSAVTSLKDITTYFSFSVTSFPFNRHVILSQKVCV